MTTRLAALIAVASLIGLSHGNAYAQWSDYDRQGMHNLMQWNRAAQQPPRTDILQQLENDVPKNLRSKKALRRLKTFTTKPGADWAISPGKLDDKAQGLSGFGLSGTLSSPVNVKVLKHVTSHLGYDTVLVRIVDKDAGSDDGRLLYMWAEGIE